MRAAQPDPTNSSSSAGSQRWAASRPAAGLGASSACVIDGEYYQTRRGRLKPAATYATGRLKPATTYITGRYVLLRAGPSAHIAIDRLDERVAGGGAVRRIQAVVVERRTRGPDLVERQPLRRQHADAVPN